MYIFMQSEVPSPHEVRSIQDIKAQGLPTTNAEYGIGGLLDSPLGTDGIQDLFCIDGINDNNIITSRVVAAVRDTVTKTITPPPRTSRSRSIFRRGQLIGRGALDSIIL